MKIHTLTLLAALLLVPLAGPAVTAQPSMIELSSLSWQFNTDRQPAPAEFAAPANTTNGFTVKLTVDLKKFDGKKTIVEIPEVLKVRLRQHDPLERKWQNYPAFKMPDGTVPVLEATIVLHSSEHPDCDYDFPRRNVGKSV